MQYKQLGQLQCEIRNHVNELSCSFPLKSIALACILEEIFFQAGFYMIIHWSSGKQLFHLSQATSTTNFERKVNVKATQLCPISLQSHGWGPARLFCPWNSPGQNIEVGSRSLLQGIFPTQKSNSDLLHFRWILYHLSTREIQECWSGQPIPSQELKQGLLHCRWALYQLSYQGSPNKLYMISEISQQLM